MPFLALTISRYHALPECEHQERQAAEHDGGAPAAVHAQQICCRAQPHRRDGGAAQHRHAERRPAPGGSQRTPLAAQQQPGAEVNVLAGCCHSAWLLTGHAQLPRPNASAIRTAGTGWTKPRAARNTNGAASAVSREAVRAAPCHRRCRGSRWLARVYRVDMLIQATDTVCGSRASDQ